MWWKDFSIDPAYKKRALGTRMLLTNYMWQFFPLKKRCLSKIKPTSYQCLYSIPSSLWQTMHQVKKKKKKGLIEFMLCNVCVHVYVNKLEPLCRDRFLSMLMLCSQVCLVLFLYLPFREIMLWEVCFYLASRESLDPILWYQ